MPEVRLTIPPEVEQKFKNLLGPDAKITDVTRDALALYIWAVGEKAKGRVVLSSNEQGDDRERITMTSLEKAREYARR
jgi:hypothetical protein